MPNNVYKQWLVLAYLEIPAEFPMVRTCLQLSVTNDATAHTRNVVLHYETPTRQTTNWFLPTYKPKLKKPKEIFFPTLELKLN
ncbi:hypothetical protein GQ41_3346 [Arenibacter algicola]|uniref:Uncharacterized protein n=1 Tax=Arenibacter algicola TaxID=616991 RepID=A0ABY3ADG3_9FLAO